ncbi:uncharacterized protein LOC131157546 isoform X2 [Malania oleifera]|uniref:uncharacterized protein LOC131157546 isoform X2 n=1 Tax=Malania oleifera TaxID=397392 RepID=UPI0025AE7CAA|nr:uncharacterized protein LOC131157546 isoform X2 [Malania oleifera]
MSAAATFILSGPLFPPAAFSFSTPHSRQIALSKHQRWPCLGFLARPQKQTPYLDGSKRSAPPLPPHGEVKAVGGGERVVPSPWDEKPYEIMPSGKKVYLDEQDIVSFLDPPKDLIPLDPASYNPAAYLWLISRVWTIAGARYDDPKLRKESASSLLSVENGAVSLEFWNCRKSGGPMPIAWINFFKKALFGCKDGKTYGRFIVLAGFANSFSRLYFVLRQVKEVISTEEPCDFAYEFGDGLFDLHKYPQGFPKPAKHPWPFSDQVVVYGRHVGPGVVVGQAWQEGKALEQVPQKLCGEILMVKDYSGYGEH